MVGGGGDGVKTVFPIKRCFIYLTNYVKLKQQQQLPLHFASSTFFFPFLKEKTFFSSFQYTPPISSKSFTSFPLPLAISHSSLSPPETIFAPKKFYSLSVQIDG